jgi:vacuolar-type H+-ATPase subunit H
MTEAVSEISRVKETGKKKVSDARQKYEKLPQHPDEPGEDSVDISEEARDRAAGKKRRNILDYLKEEPS